MLRRLLNALTLLSLLLMFAAAGMWVRSKWTYDVWSRTQISPGPRDARGWSAGFVIDVVVSRDGAVLISRESGTEYGLQFDPSQQVRRENWDHTAGFVNVPGATLPRVATFMSWMGLRVAHQVRPPGVVRTDASTRTEIDIHYWLIVLLAALLPLARTRSLARAYVRHRRRRQGLCTACGYDLRGGGERCPECGALRPP